MFWSKKPATDLAERLKLAEKMAKQMDELTDAMKADMENSLIFEADDEGDLWRGIVARLLGGSNKPSVKEAIRLADMAVFEYRRRLPKKPALNR